MLFIIFLSVKKIFIIFFIIFQKFKILIIFFIIFFELCHIFFWKLRFPAKIILYIIYEFRICSRYYQVMPSKRDFHLDVATPLWHFKSLGARPTVSSWLSIISPQKKTIFSWNFKENLAFFLPFLIFLLRWIMG